MAATTAARRTHTIPAPHAALIRTFIVLAIACVLVASGRAGATATPGWTAPLDPLEVVRGFDPPAGPYSPGHRGVDLVGLPGQPVRAAADGVVSYAGQVGGVGVVVVVHGPIRTTYQPVWDTVDVGTEVDRGDRVGGLARVGSHCAPDPCLHWGAILDDTYLDPLSLLDPAPSRLLPYWESERGLGSPTDAGELDPGGVVEGGRGPWSTAAAAAGTAVRGTTGAAGELGPAGVVAARATATVVATAAPTVRRRPLSTGVAGTIAVLGGVVALAVFVAVRRRRG